MMRFLMFLAYLLFFPNSAQFEESESDVSYQKQYYIEDDADFTNPERGFYRALTTLSSHFESIDQAELHQFRKGVQLGKSGYMIKSSLIYRGYVLDKFRDRSISDDFLNFINEDFEKARTEGFKVILRFSYVNTTHSGDCPEREICPPYGDAPKTVVLKHLEQLKPIFEKNKDVIYVVQEGLIGIWGENYYSDYFGSASDNIQGKLSDENWKDRNEVLKALLEAVPDNISVQVRIPQIKQRYVSDIHATIHAQPMTEKDAFNGSDAARIGYHNDCFLSGPSDFGTYDDNGNSISPKRADETTLKVLKSYLIAEGKYVPIGGETCNDQYAPIDQCELALLEMTEQHFDFLNADYHPGLIERWSKEGCLETIKQRLGYRFVLKSSILPDKVLKSKDKMSVAFEIENKGFSAPYLARPVQVVLRNSATGVEYKSDLNTDIRKWYAGKLEINENLTLPNGINPGKYRVFLNMPDGNAELSDRPDYSIRLANKDTWETSTGYNDLGHTIVID